MENITREEILTPEEIYSLIRKYEESGIKPDPKYGVYRNALAMRIVNYFGSEGDSNSRILANLIAQRLAKRTSLLLLI